MASLKDLLVTGSVTILGPVNMSQGASTIKLTGYEKASAASAVAATDTINAAIGKIEKALDGKQVSGSYASSSHTHDTSDISGLGGAATKSVVTSIDTSASLPTSNAVKTFVENKGYITSYTNTTYSLSEDKANNKITLTPNSGTAQDIYIPLITYGTCSTAASTVAKVVDCPNFALVTGASIRVKFTVTNTGAVSNLTLNVNNTGAKNIKYRNANLPSAGTLAANRVYEFVYDGTYWQLVGDLDTDSNTTYTAATAAPGNVSSSSSVGTSTNYARQDHTHGISLATGDNNGQVKIAGTNVSVKGLGSAAYTDSSAYATSDHTHSGYASSDHTHSTGTSSAAGFTKLYTGTGTNTDGTMTQSAIKTALNGKASSSHSHSTGTSSAAGFTKLYTGTGTNTDGTMTQSAIKTALDGKASSSHTHSGYASSDHNHNSTYLALAGGTMTGTIIMPANDNIGIEPKTSNYGYVGSSSKKFYKMYANTFYGNLTGTASTASRLANTSAVGSSTNPVYFSNSGVPVACTMSDYVKSSFDNSEPSFKRVRTLDLKILDPDFTSEYDVADIYNDLGTLWVDGTVVQFAKDIYAPSYQNNSSLKYKDNVLDMPDEVAKELLSLRPVVFDYKNGIKDCKGLIAEEAYKVDRYQVGLKDNEPDSIDYTRYIAQLIKMIQIQNDRIDKLEKIITKNEI